MKRVVETMPIEELPPFSSPEVMRKFLEMLEGLTDTPYTRDVREKTLRDLRRLEEFLAGNVSNHAVRECSPHSRQVLQRGSLKNPLAVMANVLDREADEETEPRLQALKRFRAEALRELARQESEPTAE